jgi:hypothetical protein
MNETVLVFTSAYGECMTKTITQTPDGGWAKENAQPATMFSVTEAEFSDHEGLLDILKVLLPHPTAFIVRGGLERPIAEGEQITKRHSENYPGDDRAVLIEAHRRWVPIDFDDVPMGDDYSLTHVDDMIDKAIKRYLPELFHDVTVVWELSAGAGTKSDGTLNCHLFFLTNWPMGTIWLREFMKAFAPAADTSIYKFGQPLYTAAPIIINGPDPVPTRLGIVRKSDDMVVMPVVTFEEIEKYAVSKGVGLLSHATGFEAKLALMGHGDDALCGFHAPIREAAASYVSGKMASEIDIPALIERIKVAVAVAPKEEHRGASYYKIYSDEKYLENQITSGMAKFCRKPIKPFYPEGEPDLEKVRETLLRDVETALIDGVAAAAALYHPGEKFMDTRKAKVTMMQVGTGLGKTRSALLAIVKLTDEVKRVRAELTAQIKPLADKRKAEGRELSDILDIEEYALRETRVAVTRMARVVYAVPTHKLGEEVVGRVWGITAALWRGRGADDPEWNGKELEAAKMCWRSSMLELLIESGIAASSMCRLKETYCPHFNDCGYQRQISRCRHADVVVVPHASLAHTMPAINTRDTLIIDESFWPGTLAGPIDIKLSRLRQWAKSDTSWQDIYATVVDAPDGNVDMTALEMPLTDLEQLRKGLDRSGHPPFQPDWSRSQIQRAVENAGVGNEWRRQHQLLNNLIHAKNMNHDVAVWVRKQGDTLKLTWRSPIRKGWRGRTTLLIDASLDPEIAKISFPAATHDFNIQPALFAAAPHVTALQVIDQPFGIRKFFDADGQPLQTIGEMLAFIRLVSLSGTTLVIAQQKLEAELEQRGLPDNVTLSHFNAIRGIDKWKDVRNAVVIGRTAPTPMEIEDLTEHLTGAPLTSSLCPDRSKFRWYMDREKGVRLSDGTGYAVKSDWHPDAMAERLRHQVADEEVEQSIERPRGVNRTAENPVKYYIMTNTVTRQVVQHPVLWETIRPGKFEQMMGAGLVLFNSADMAAVYPDLWENPIAVRNWRNRTKGHEVCHSLLGDHLIGNDTLPGKPPTNAPMISLVHFGYVEGHYQRSKPHAKRCRFWYHPNLCPEPKQRLIEILGPLRLFDLAAAKEPDVAA